MGFMASMTAKQGRTNAQRYEVDAAMMGQTWNNEDLRRFCGILQAVVGERISIIRIDHGHSGARNASPLLVTEDQRIRALRQYEEAAR